MPDIPSSQPIENAGDSGISPAKLEIVDFASRVFRNTRKLRIWLPPGYANTESAKRLYPVFYLNDGQNLFDPATSFTHVAWQVGETAEVLIREDKIPALIVVGMDNAQNERIREYVPYRSFRPPLFRPLGGRYSEFLDEVMALVAMRYRVAQGPANTGLGGSSLGGLIALYTAFERPGLIGKLLAESPSLFFAKRRFLRQSRHFREWPERVYLGIGTAESGQPEKDRQFVADLIELESGMVRAGLDDRRLRVWVEDGAGHNEGSWARRFPEALAFLFGR
ncbi:MAG TPA: alpha/beta hydrolase-fold protein [Terriglobales bacterium]